MQLIARKFALMVGGEKHRQETKLRLDNEQVPALASKGIEGSLCSWLMRA